MGSLYLFSCLTDVESVRHFARHNSYWSSTMANNANWRRLDFSSTISRSALCKHQNTKSKLEIALHCCSNWQQMSNNTYPFRIQTATNTVFIDCTTARVCVARLAAVLLQCIRWHCIQVAAPVFGQMHTWAHITLIVDHQRFSLYRIATGG